MRSRVATISPIAVAAVLVATMLAACNDDGRTLSPAPPPTTAAGVPSIDQVDDGAAPDQEVAADDPVVAATELTLTSPSFVDGGILDAQFTCDGLDVAPPLDVAALPAATAEVAVSVVDTDADDFVHWVTTGLPASITRLDAATSIEATFARNDRGTEGWSGPCPSPGDGFHAYVFTVYALAEPLGVTPGLGGTDAIELLEASALDTAQLTGYYQRAGGT